MNIGDYKDAFLTEAREYLSTLNNSLVLLEKNQTQTDAINDIFRAAHTLKGMAATMGYDPMVRLTHQMETLLEPIRSGTQNPFYPNGRCPVCLFGSVGKMVGNFNDARFY